MAQADQGIVALLVGVGETGRPVDEGLGQIAGVQQGFAQGAKVALFRHLVEAAHLHVDRMDFPPAQKADNRIAGLLQLQRHLHRVAMPVGGHFQGARIAQEIGRMQHRRVQHMAFDPLAAIQHPPQVAQRAVDRDAQGRLHRVNRTHLVGDRADAADPRGDVGGFGEIAALKESFEKPGRLEDAEFGAHDLAVAQDDLERAFALDAGQHVDLDGSIRHGPLPPPGTRARWC